MAKHSTKEITGLSERRQNRRMEAERMFSAEAKQAQVASKLRVSWQTAHAWLKAWKAGGQNPLKSKGKPGAVPKFNDLHLFRLVQLLAQEPRAHI